ncbi:MAG: hypothetical protein R3D66_07135 [Alphaproteobacteria bacterium]
MSETDVELLRRIERLIAEFKGLVDDAVGTPAEAALTYGLRSLAALANMIMLDMDIFCVEPWHALRRDVPLPVPGEMLLRLKDYKGRPLTPYSALMAFYEHGYTAQIDTILFLAAMNQLAKSEEKRSPRLTCLRAPCRTRISSVRLWTASSKWVPMRDGGLSLKSMKALRPFPWSNAF